MKNPLLEPWSDPWDIPDFDKITSRHFLPAVQSALKITRREIDAITASTEKPTFENTIVAMERSGELLNKLALLLFNINGAETSPAIQVVARKVSPLLTRLSNDITLNETLFTRVNKIYETRTSRNYSSEEMMLIEAKYRSFLKGGASLSLDKRGRFREISEKLSTLSLRYEENLLAETNSYCMLLTLEDEVAGLPAATLEAAEKEASTRDAKGWAFTLHAPSFIPFMQYSEQRNLREKLFKAYLSRASQGKYDNKEIIKEIVNLRLEKAQLLGFDCHASYVLGDKMAESPEKVESFLSDLSSKSHPYAIDDYNRVSEFARSTGHEKPIERWDWAYYSEKLKKSLFNVDDESFRPYFQLEKAIAATFTLANDIYGITFKEEKSTTYYHKEVSAWEVIDHNGEVLALLLGDFHPREGKNGGAWMTNYREQKKVQGKNIRPVVSIVTNFPRPSATRPSLLSFNELTTLLHEFGHALHSILSQCTYESLAGTNVARDFVELPSQFMENFALEMDWLNRWAKHYQSDENIPAELIDKIKALSHFNEGYACDRQLSFGLLDMAYHNLTQPMAGEVVDFETETAASLDLFPGVDGICFSCSFAHIFAGGYSSGYYGYKWAEVLDADAFELFKESGVFSKECGSRFREHILEKGGTGKPMDLYIKFRGKEPSLEAFMVRSGFTVKAS